MCSKIFAVCLLMTMLVCVTAQNATTAATTIAEALQFSARSLYIIQDFVTNELPETAKAEGNVMLSAARDGFKYCESLLQTVEDIWQYKKCGSEQLGSSLEALGWLKKRYEPYNSGAAALRPFSFY